MFHGPPFHVAILPSKAPVGQMSLYRQTSEVLVSYLCNEAKQPDHEEKGNPVPASGYYEWCLGHDTTRKVSQKSTSKELEVNAYAVKAKTTLIVENDIMV